MLVGVLTKSTTLLKMRLQMSESYATVSYTHLTLPTNSRV